MGKSYRRKEKKVKKSSHQKYETHKVKVNSLIHAEVAYVTNLINIFWNPCPIISKPAKSCKSLIKMGLPVGSVITRVSSLAFLGASLAFVWLRLQDVLFESSLSRLVASIAVPLLIAFRGLHKQSLSITGSLLALWVGFVLTLAHPSVMIGLIFFFLSSSKATRFRQHLKRKIEGQAFKRGTKHQYFTHVTAPIGPLFLQWLHGQ